MLDANEIARVRYYLGYSTFEDNGPLQRMIDTLQSGTRPDAETIVRAELTKLASIDQSIDDLVPIALAVQDGAIQLRGHYSLGVLRSMGRQRVGRLAATLEIGIKRDVFSEGAPGIVGTGDPSAPTMDYGFEAKDGSCH